MRRVHLRVSAGYGQSDLPLLLHRIVRAAGGIMMSLNNSRGTTPTSIMRPTTEPRPQWHHYVAGDHHDADRHERDVVGQGQLHGLIDLAVIDRLMRRRDLAPLAFPEGTDNVTAVQGQRCQPVEDPDE